MVHPPRPASPAVRVTMGIDRVGPRGFPASPPEAPAATHDEGGFASLLPGGQASPAGAAAAGAAGASPAAAGVAWLQEGIADALGRGARDKQARRHGRAMLQALGAVQLAMLGCDDGQARAALAALAGAADDPHEADDPVLQSILREIALRAAVELARDGAAGGHLATDVSNA